MCAIKNRSAFFLLALALAGLAVAQSGEFWEKKSYQQWSEKECRKLLDESPWTGRYSLTQILIEPLQKPGLDRGSDISPDVRIPNPPRSDDSGRAREARPEVIYQAQIRSALPIRQALVRLEQLRVNYDQMRPDLKRVADQRAEQFLAARFPDTVVLHVSYRSNVQIADRELAHYWHSQTSETLKNFVFLIGSRGEKVPLLNYSVAEGASREFQLTFPRVYKGHPLVSAQDKTLQLEFPHPGIRGQSGSLILIPFKIDKMLLQGTVNY